MRRLLCAVLITCCGITINAANASIINGDFATCDFTGWGLDTDGFGEPIGTEDFSINGVGGDCSADILVDDGVTASAFFANTLFTELDLSAAPNEILTLSFDWAFSGTDGDPLFGDFFTVYLSDGSGSTFDATGENGYLVAPMSAYGAGLFSVVLDATLHNLVGWTLEFQLLDAFSPADPLYSVLNIDNVQLQRSAADVPVGGSVFLLMIAGIGVAARRHFSTSQE